MADRGRTPARPSVFHHSAGAVVVADGRCLLLQRADNGEWVFPKGHLERDEAPVSAAIREVLEEAGLVVEIDRELGSTRYRFGPRRHHRKRVDWFLAHPVGGSLQPEAGFATSTWLEPDAAVRRLAHDDDREIARLAFEDETNDARDR